MVKSKFRSETHTPLKAQPPKEGDSEKKAATEGPKPKQMHRRVNTDIHNRLLEVRTEYQKKELDETPEDDVHVDLIPLQGVDRTTVEAAHGSGGRLGGHHVVEQDLGQKIPVVLCE